MLRIKLKLYFKLAFVQPTKRENINNVCVHTLQVQLRNPALVAFGKILIIYEGTSKVHMISSNHDTEMINAQR